MLPLVELINNPYLQKLKILINGKPISVYSNLEKYINEPFVYWCDRIFDDIYEECNQSEFCLHFQSRHEEIAVIEKLAYVYPYCVQYSSSPLVRYTPLLDRIKALHNLIKQNSIKSYRNFKICVLFIIPDTMKNIEMDLKGLEVKNVFCQIKSEILYYQDYRRNPQQADFIFVLSDNLKIEDSIKYLEIYNGFGIFIGSKQSFNKKIKDIFIYETTIDKIFDTIFECLLLVPLANAFVDCLNSFQDVTIEQYKDEIEELRSISVKIIPKPEKTVIEVGRSSSIHFSTDNEGYEIKGNQLYYRYSKKGIIQCNGILVEGLQEGDVTLFVFKEGEYQPCASVDYQVIKRNRITEIQLDETEIYLGEGDNCQIEYMYIPSDADNVKSIEWQSDDESVAKVDSHGNVRAQKKGNCNLRCFAEQVSARCRCIVLPHLESIIPEVSEIDMVYGEQKSISFKTIPSESCIDGNVAITSMDMQIANIIGNTINAVGIGDTKIVIQNRQETVRAEIQVHIMSEKEYYQKQKQLQTNSDSSSKKKKGLLSKLFG